MNKKKTPINKNLNKNYAKTNTRFSVNTVTNADTNTKK